MLVKKFFAGFLVVLLLMFCSGFVTGCAKEYSFEGSPADTVVLTEPVPLPASSCALCNTNNLSDSTWQFTIDGVRYCGKAEKAIITLERTSFTFFGASSCSSDSGFVASVYINDNALDTDKVNVSARLACFYYDQVGPSNVFMSAVGQPLQLSIATYNRQTGMAKGSFQGAVVLKNGIRKEIKNGQFQIRL